MTVCGYSNWETFTVAAELENDKRLTWLHRDGMLYREAMDCLDDARIRDDAATDLAEWLADYHREQMDAASVHGPLHTMLEASLNRVSFYEIAEEIIRYVTEEDVTEEEME